jgi:hypothetical protein
MTQNLLERKRGFSGEKNPTRGLVGAAETGRVAPGRRRKGMGSPWILARLYLNDPAE